MLKTPDGTHGIELIEFVTPSALDGDSRGPANTIGLRHVCFEVDDIEDTVRRLERRGGELLGEIVNYEDFYLLRYLRGPDGIIGELAQAFGSTDDAQQALAERVG